MSVTKFFKYINVVWQFIFSENTMELILPFYRDYFVEIDNCNDCDFTVRLIESKYSNIQKILLRGEDILIHNSEKPLFHDKGKKLDIGNVRYVFNCITKSIYEINYVFNEINIYNSDVEMLVRDGIRVSRDFVKIFTDNSDFSMFHCSAVLNDSKKCIVFIGEKSKGKTTISLDLIYNHNFYELSRDRTYLGTKNGTLHVYGWPTYYNLTMKTIKYFDETKHLLPSKYKQIDDVVLGNITAKLQLLPADIGINRTVREAEVSYLVILIRKDEECDLRRIISKNSFSPYDTYTTEWHGINRNKSAIIDRVRGISEKIMNFKNTIILNVDDDINITIKSLLEKIDIKGE